MQLANMQDIGGCRAVLADIEELRRVQRRLKRNRPPIRENDYITNPRSSGYRGVHVIVWYEERNGIQRNIEVQLRTPVMHEWAIAVERLGGRLQADLKGEQGPTPVLEWLAAISEATAFEEAGQPVDTPLVDRIELLRRDALPFLEDLRMRGAQ